MTFHYRVSGEARKALVKAMGEILECKPVYMFMPTKNYMVDYFTIDPNGDVSFDDRADSDEVEMLVEALLERGFEPEDAPIPEPEQPTETETVDDAPAGDFVVSVPADGFDVNSFGRLHALVAAKHTLLQKALDTELLPVRVLEDRIEFPWFHGDIDADHAQAYAELVSRICVMAKNSKRVTAKDRETDNDKYAFRCFLLRLGFIGDEFKRHRKVLLEKLDGSSAFRHTKEADA